MRIVLAALAAVAAFSGESWFLGLGQAASLIMAALLNGMSLLAVPPEARFIARGVVLALAAWLDAMMRDDETVFRDLTAPR